MSALLNHVEQLKWRHKVLDNRIEEAYNSYAPDDKIKKMKHEKFLLKEELRLLEEHNDKEVGDTDI